ncbi:MAG: hypothetical protein EHM23_11280 [Acidobacteria bacterium]|nr:MAG: hypothetical protein EHM23_11280 [Acidobacteriota bacterium]
MNCEGWRIEIAAFLDRSSDPRMSSRVRGHLETCSSCLEFYREQSELNALLGSSELEADPPEHLWYRIESQIAQRQEVPASRWTFLANLWGFWYVPRLRYALVTCLFLLVASWSLLELKSRRDADQVFLARIDAYELKVVEGNPFLSDIRKSAPVDNPFLSMNTATSNPFESKGSRQ